MAKQAKEKPEKTRTEGSYPYTSLRAVQKLTDAVKEFGGDRTEVPKSIIAKHLGLGESSPGLYTLTASAKAFGIVEGSRGLSLTEIGRRYYFPVNNSDRREAELDIFGSPPSFQILIRRFDGNRVPPLEMLSSILEAENVAPKSWALRIASFFVNSAADLGLIDDSGFLRYAAARASMHTAQSQPQVSRATGTNLVDLPPVTIKTATDSGRGSDTVAISDSDVPTAVKSNTHVWTYSGSGGMVRLETSEPLPISLWDRLRRYVDVLKPDEPEKSEGQVVVSESAAGARTEPD